MHSTRVCPWCPAKVVEAHKPGANGNIITTKRALPLREISWVVAAQQRVTADEKRAQIRVESDGCEREVPPPDNLEQDPVTVVVDDKGYWGLQDISPFDARDVWSTIARQCLFHLKEV